MNIENLKKARENNHLTQAQAAKKLGVSDGAYKNYEQGKREPSNDLLCKISDLYGVTTDYLLGRPDSKPPQSPIEEFAQKSNLKDLEEILIKEYLNLSEPQRNAVLDFLRNAIEKEIARKADSVQSNAQSQPEQIKRDTYEFSDLAIARSSNGDYKPAPTDEQYDSFEELTDDMLGE